MNKKNKNKNRSKLANPTPTQNLESVNIVEETVTVLAEENPVSLVKESDNVIKTTAETTEPVQGNDETPTDTPKKPKRNKGKKKRQEEISADETKSASSQDLAAVTHLLPESKVKNESIAETIETKVEGDKNTEENIIANVRKKKNKKKPSDQQKMEQPSQVDLANFSENIEENIVTTEHEINTPEMTEFDVKQSKKKNKKKKQRRDSEKSDKPDEVVTCTAAFQKLIGSTDNEGDINPDTHIESSEDVVEGDKNLSTSVREETLKDLIESVLLPEEAKQSEDDILQHDQINESKSKKKAKKDKKQQQQQPKKDSEKDNIIQEPITQEEPSVLGCDIIHESPLIEQESALKDIPQTKAKCAKPVDKKRKGKSELLENREGKLEEHITLTELGEPVVELEKKPEHIFATVSSPDVQISSEIVTTEQGNKSEPTLMTSDKCSETLIPTNALIPPIDAPIATSNLNLADVNIGIKSNEEITECSVITSDPILLKFDKESENNSNASLFPLETSVEKDNDIPIPSEPYKTVEKKKKKHPKKIDISSEKTHENKVLVTPESDPIKEEISIKPKDTIFSELSTPEHVEICSIKTVELDDSSDVTPDFIHHPLATSQQLVDDNNNLIISEITSTDEKLSLHLMIPSDPIIQDSGETPESIGEKISIEPPKVIEITEKSLTNEPEKTDLKSKMMEVSQDMEELRLSIERSLAELTSMERSEHDVVKTLDEIEPPKLDTKTDLIPCAVNDDKSEKSKSLCENKLAEIILPETHNTSGDLTKNIEVTTQEHEMLLKTEKVEEKNMQTPALAKSAEDKQVNVKETPPQVPTRKDNKGKGKGKKKGKQEIQAQQTTPVSETSTVTTTESTTKEVKSEEKQQPEQKSKSSESNENKGKQQQALQLEHDGNGSEQVTNDLISNIIEMSYEPIEHFEDALTSSVDDVNKTFEMIANEVDNTPDFTLQNPQINITSPTEDTETAEPKQNPVSPPKNLLGHPDIPVPSNRTDYKKEKNKPPNMRQAKVKIKDAVEIEKTEKTKQSKESQTENKRTATNYKNVLESFSYMTNENAEYVYKYSFRKVFLQSLCHVCRKELDHRVSCQFCSIVFYCSQKHKDEDWPQHQSLCFAICTISHLKDQKHIYADAKNITGQSYRLLRMQMILSCEKVLKRKLVPWEQEALLYPRICADVACREWKQSKLADCEGCGQISYCSEHPEHLPAGHQRWCRSYALYQKLVHHQQTTGRLEPKLPTKIVTEGYRIPEKINEVLAAMYDEKIDMTDMEYAALTQLATAPLTAAYCHQIATASHSNGISKRTSFVVHVVGAELQFEADVLFKWEVFLLHLKPDVKELRVVLVSPDLNPSNLPLNLLEKVNLCENCRAEKRRVLFSFQDKKTYYEYWASDEFLAPDIVCALNPSIQRSSMYNGKDTWPTGVSCILKLKTPFVVSAYSIDELNRDIVRIRECSELSGVGFKIISEPKCNPFASVRPDRNFITDDEIPLLFKNYCIVVLCGV